jgi:hypothetical protein
MTGKMETTTTFHFSWVLLLPQYDGVTKDAVVKPPGFKSSYPPKVI